MRGGRYIIYNYYIDLTKQCKTILFQTLFCIHIYRRLIGTMSKKKLVGGVKCAIDHIVEAQENGEITEDNVLFIVENINVAGNYICVC